MDFPETESKFSAISSEVETWKRILGRLHVQQVLDSLRQKELRSFPMFCSFNEIFVFLFSLVVVPLHELVGKDTKVE